MKNMKNMKNIKPRQWLYLCEVTSCIVLGWYAPSTLAAMGWAMVIVFVGALIDFWNQFNDPRW